ncbi:TPA: hypothetical protein M4198_002720 [Klebsiella variicola]|nr:hypothetical protein [Klebsiella variicola]
MAYETNVFINCPFDNAYDPFFDAALFAIYRCKFKPRCALEINDAGDQRIDKINNIIKECKVGIHDISRTELDEGNGLPRFNMPLELGLFLGAKKFSSAQKQKNKHTIIVDRERHRYQMYISDIAGQDIMTHNNTTSELIRIIRNALNSYGIVDALPSAQIIIDDYNAFLLLKPDICIDSQLDINDLTYSDKTRIIELYLEFNAAVN